MKKIYVLFIALSLSLASCTSNSSSSSSSQYPMTAKINGATFQAYSPLGDNMFSISNIWNYFPIEDYVLIQGRQGGVAGNPEIDIWLKRSDMVVGTYTIGHETYATPPSHFIDLIDLTTSDTESTKNGTIAITSVNTSTKMVQGTFSFTAVLDPSDPTSPVVYTVTNGTFNYKYAE
jgi:hypothetical protein